jgi:hypothetical protein
MVVAPPIWLVVPTLPTFSTTVTHGGETYLYANDTYYRPRPDLGGYEVVNDPVEASSQSAPDALVGGQLPGAAAATSAAATSGAVSALATPSAVITPGVSPPVSGAAATAPIAAKELAVAPPASAATTAIPMPTAPTATPVPLTLPTAQASASTSGSPDGPKVVLYPKNGQTPDQQARDRYECYRFAVAQSGFDPMRPTRAPSQGNEPQSNYERAQSACFEARGYASR